MQRRGKTKGEEKGITHVSFVTETLSHAEFSSFTVFIYSLYLQTHLGCDTHSICIQSTLADPDAAWVLAASKIKARTMQPQSNLLEKS